MNNAVPIVIGNSVPACAITRSQLLSVYQVFRLEHAFRDGVGRYPQKWAEDLVGGIFKDEFWPARESPIAGYQRIRPEARVAPSTRRKSACVGEGAVLREGNQLLQFLEEKTERGAAQDKVEETFLFDLYGPGVLETRRQPTHSSAGNTL